MRMRKRRNFIMTSDIQISDRIGRVAIKTMIKLSLTTMFTMLMVVRLPSSMKVRSER